VGQLSERLFGSCDWFPGGPPNPSGNRATSKPGDEAGRREKQSDPQQRVLHVVIRRGVQPADSPGDDLDRRTDRARPGRESGEPKQKGDHRECEQGDRRCTVPRIFGGTGRRSAAGLRSIG
jgi:hypothetical protein